MSDCLNYFISKEYRKASSKQINYIKYLYHKKYSKSLEADLNYMSMDEASLVINILLGKGGYTRWKIKYDKKKQN